MSSKKTDSAKKLSINVQLNSEAGFFLKISIFAMYLSSTLYISKILIKIFRCNTKFDVRRMLKRLFLGRQRFKRPNLILFRIIPDIEIYAAR